MSTTKYDQYGEAAAALLRAKDRAIEEAKQKAAGSFFAKTRQVWGLEAAKLTTSSDNWKLFDRTKNKFDWECLGMSKARKTKMVYKNTRDHARGNYEIVSAKGSQSSTSADTKKAIWKTDVVGNPNVSIAEGAHLLPAGEEIDHVEWFQVGAAAVGINESASVATKLKALRGCKNGSRRFDYEGVLHFVSNRLLMAAQKYALDGDHPRMMIVPVLDHEGVRDWTGSGYKAIVLVGNPHNEIPLEDQLPDNEIHDTYQKCGFSHAGIAQAEPGEVETARVILRVGILALAEMIQSLTEEDLKGVENQSTKGSSNLRRAKQSLDERKSEVHVPKKLSEDEHHVHVAKVQFVDHDGTNGHPAPDPFLLLMKAANIWARLTGMKFLANASLPNFDTEKDVQAQEIYLRYKESLERNTSREELARGLGQL